MIPVKFSCEKNLLIEAVTAVARAVPQKSAVQVLEGILLRCAKGKLSLTGYDLDIGIESSLEASVQEQGAVVLKARMLSEIVRKLPGSSVSVTCGEKNTVIIRSGASEFTLLGIPAEDYPQMPEVLAERTLEMSEAALKSTLRQTLFAVSDNENRPILTGSLFKVDKDVLTVVSVDGFRLAMRTETVKNPSMEQFSFVVPGKALAEVARLCGESDRAVYISLAKKYILFGFESVTLVSRLLEGEFIDYDSVIPKGGKVTALIDTALLTAAVERASLVVSEKIKNPVVFNFDFDSLKITTKSGVGSVYDELSVTLSGEPLEIGLNNSFMLDALRACDSETIKISMTTSLSPIVITAPEQSKFLFLVVPMRYKTNE